MKKTAKKLLAFVLAFSMIATTFSGSLVTVQAEEYGTVQETVLTEDAAADETASAGEDQTEQAQPESTLEDTVTEENAVVLEGNTPEDGEETEDPDAGEDSAAAEKLTLNQTEISLKLTEGENTFALEAEIEPEEAKDAELTWASKDEKIATVDETGLVTAAANGVTTITVSAGEVSASCIVIVGTPVFFNLEQDDATLKVSDYETKFEVYPYEEMKAELSASAPSEEDSSTETLTTDETEEGTEEAEPVKGEYVVCLDAGAYTYTVTADGYYGSTCAFTVTEEGKTEFTTSWTATVKEEYGLYELLDTENGVFNVNLEQFVKSGNAGAWDGTTLDVSWFDPAGDTFYVGTPAQLAGMAAIVNGIYNDEITAIIDYDANGALKTFTPEEYEAYEGAKIVTGCSKNDIGGPNGQNQVTSSDYYFSGKGYDFDKQTVYLTADLDMGGYQTADGTWTGARYMPIGGQYQMYYVKKGIADGYSHIGGSFNGTFDGQGHIVYNIYCDRYSVTNYGDSSTIGLFGRIGIHDGDYDNWLKSGNEGGNYPPTNPTVRNVAVDGYIYGRRSVGGVVGKLGRTSKTIFADGSIGSIVENCVNFATVNNTDAKGCGGIVGAGWNGGIVRNCVNFGNISSTYNNPTGGIVGSSEVSVVNCYNVGKIAAKSNSYAMAIGTNNGGGYDVRNCYWLTGTAPGGGFYGSVSDKKQIVEITDNYNESGMTAAEYLASSEFLTALNSTARGFKKASSSDLIYSFLSEVNAQNYPVPNEFTTETAKVEKLEKRSDATKLVYVEGERFDPTGLEIYAVWSDGTEQRLENYTYSIDRTLELGDTQITLSVSAGGFTETVTYDITVTKNELSLILPSSQLSRDVYNIGECYDPSTIVILLWFTNGNVRYAKWTEGNIFVDAYDPSIVYDITVAWIDEPLTMEMHGKDVLVSCKYDGVTRYTTLNTLYIVSEENKPLQDENGTYLVGNAAELEWVMAQINGGIKNDVNVTLIQDLELDSEYIPIGEIGNTYSGVFDGAGHSVTMKIDTIDDYTALFGFTDGAEIKNLVVKGNVTGGNYSAGIVANAANTLIENCGNEADIKTTYSYAGGITAYINGSTKIVNCYNTGDVKADSASAGIVARYYGSEEALIENCYNTGAITTTSTKTANIAGIVGYVGMALNVNHVYNTGEINTSLADRYKTAIAGNASSSNLANVTDYYWFKDSAACAMYETNNSKSVMTGACTTEELVAADLGEGFIENEGCAPVLSWQTPSGHQMNTANQTCEKCGYSEKVLTGTWKKGVNGRWWYSISDGTYPYSCRRLIDGEMYAFDKNGYMITGWADIDGEWSYHLSSGIAAKGWAAVSGKWYYMDAEGIMVSNEWVGDYYLTSSGAMATGWQNISGEKYYFNASGIKMTGWVKVGSKWYHMDSYGVMDSDLWIIDAKNNRYYVDANGVMATGWQQIRGTWYYFNASGIIQKGWVKSSGKWYYMNEVGAMQVSKWILNETYYVNASGVMVTGWQQIDGYWYYFDASGVKATSKWISGVYYVKADGKMAVSEWVDNGKYYVDANGKWVPNKQK